MDDFENTTNVIVNNVVLNSIIDKLKVFTNKRFIYFFDSGDDAIFYLINYQKKLGKKLIIIPDMGGWFSYKKFPKKLGLEIIELKTDDALINTEDLKSLISQDISKNISQNYFLLMNSMGGYFVSEPMHEIEDCCKDNKLLLINDVSASIGTQNAKYGDFCVGSFGENKPLELGIGGFIGSNTELVTTSCKFFNEDNMKKLSYAITILEEKSLFWQEIRKMIKEDLSKYNIIHKDLFGINVIVEFNNDSEKENLINYCNNHMLEYKVCPNYIKVNRDAVSIEVKRIPFKEEN